MTAFPKKILAAAYQCGETYTDSLYIKNDCECDNTDFISGSSNTFNFCCGWLINGTCYAEPNPIPTFTPTPTDDEAIEIPEVDANTLNRFNPLIQFADEDQAARLSTPGGIISEVLSFAFPIAGIILFVMMIMAGFKILSGATNSKAVDEGKQMITSALIGFIILFAAYWIAQLIELIFGISILGN